MNEDALNNEPMDRPPNVHYCSVEEFRDFVLRTADQSTMDCGPDTGIRMVFSDDLVKDARSVAFNELSLKDFYIRHKDEILWEGGLDLVEPCELYNQEESSE